MALDSPERREQIATHLEDLVSEVRTHVVTAYEYSARLDDSLDGGEQVNVCVRLSYRKEPALPILDVLRGAVDRHKGRP